MAPSEEDGRFRRFPRKEGSSKSESESDRLTYELGEYVQGTHFFFSRVLKSAAVTALITLAVFQNFDPANEGRHY